MHSPFLEKSMINRTEIMHGAIIIYSQLGKMVCDMHDWVLILLGFYCHLSSFLKRFFTIQVQILQGPLSP